MSGGTHPSDGLSRGGWLLLLASAGGFAVLLFSGLAHPLFWSDEADTAMFARRTIEFGYPKVHDGRNVVYQFGSNIALGVDERSDAYIGTTWGQFYFAAPGVAWAEGVADPGAKTARVRLPFAAAGAFGLVLFAASVWPALPRGRRALFGALFFACACLSISLVLHLREARYYPLVVLLVGALVFVQLRFAVFHRLGLGAYSAAITALLFLLFNTFFAAFFCVLAVLAVDRIRHGPRALLPLLPALVAVAPLLVYFETFRVAAAFSRELALGPGGLLENLGTVGAHLLRHEFLLPALACRAALLVCDALARRAGAASPGGPARAASAFLWLLAAGYALVGCANPLPLERYFVVLSPILTLLFLLDAFSLVAAISQRAAPARRTLAVRAAVAALIAISLAARFSAPGELAGHVASLRTPVRGPIDFVVDWVRERHPEPERLVIATNYEEEALMYYLGSRVIIGLALNNLAEDRGLEPDLVIPRRRWRSSLPEVVAFLHRGRWERFTLPVVDLHYNNIPALSRSRFLPDPHRFRTAVPREEGEALVIYQRVASSKETGTSSGP
ncbi:MAG TPA: hypothetical protein VII72_05080 [Myxococcota bacterium]|jgi:hypothetical protein